jgi:hypothetical protein
LISADFDRMSLTGRTADAAGLVFLAKENLLIESHYTALIPFRAEDCEPHNWGCQGKYCAMLECPIQGKSRRKEPTNDQKWLDRDDTEGARIRS